VGGRVEGGRSLALIKAVVCLQARLIAVKRARAITLDLCRCACHAPDPHVVDLALEAIPATRGTRPVVRSAADPDPVDRRIVVLDDYSGDCPLKLAINVQALRLGLVVDDQGHLVPSTIVDGKA